MTDKMKQQFLFNTGTTNENQSDNSDIDWDSVDNEFHHMTLDSGLQIALNPNPNHHGKIYFTVIAKAGSIHDPIGQEGISHYMEHLLVKDDYSDQMAKRGGAVTTLETNDQRIKYSAYVQDTPENLGFILQTIDNFIQGPLHTEKTETERSPILNEWGSFMDDPGFRHNLLGKRLYKPGPAPHNPIGEESVIATLSSQDLANFKKEMFVGQNIVIGIRGNFDPETIKKALKKRFQNMPPQSHAIAAKPEFEPGKDIRVENHHLQQVYFGFYFPCTKITPDTFMLHDFTMDYLKEALFKHIRTKNNLVYGIGAGTSATGYNGHLSITGNIRQKISDQLTPELAKFLAQSITTLDQETLETIRTREITSISDIAREGRYSNIMAENIHNTGRVFPLKEAIDFLQNVTAEDVQNHLATIVTQQPSILHYGNSSQMQPLAEFQHMLATEKTKRTQQPEPPTEADLA